MNRIRIRVILILLCISILGFLGKFTNPALAQSEATDQIQESTPAPPTGEAKPENTKPAGDAATLTPDQEVTPTPTSAISEVTEELGLFSSRELFTLEGPLTRWISDLASQFGWDQINFLGLTLEDWINLAISILLTLLLYVLGKRFIHRALRFLLERTKVEKVDEFLETINSPINWLVMTIALQLNLARLTFLSSGLRVLLNRAFFVAYLTILSILLWNTIGFAAEVLLQRNRTDEEIQRLRPIYIVARRVLESLLIIGYLSILLSYFGIDITAFAAALGIGGLAISLAAQDTLADAIAGFLILIDQPFRVGDRIEISGLGTWGDVVDIGTRTTRIRTRDNRMVIVPNSAIAKDQIINYSYPDPRYRVQIEVGIDYDSDLKLAREAAIHAVKDVEGVLLDKPIDALFVDFGDSAITLRIRWWIDSYIDTRRMFDKVNEALLVGFNEAGIKMPNITYDLNLKVDERDAKQFTEKIRPETDDFPTNE